MTSNGGKNLRKRAGGEGRSDDFNFPDYLGQLSRPILRRVRILKKYQMESLEIESQFYKRVHELEKAGGDERSDDFNFPDYLEQLSRRILKKDQMESLEIESQFYERVHELKKEFQPLFAKVNSKRAAIVSGEYEIVEIDQELPKLIEQMSITKLEKMEEDVPVEGGEPSKGIPGFWFHTLNSVASISGIIKEHDEPILKYLIDINTEVHKEPPGFSLLFHFAENPYFTNAVLTKYYEMDSNVDKQKPTEIEWNEGKNVTQNNESFFNFFDPKVDEKENQTATKDIEIGQTIRDQVIPRAVLFFTGEGPDDDGKWGFVSRNFKDEDIGDGLLDEQEGPSEPKNRKD